MKPGFALIQLKGEISGLPARSRMTDRLHHQSIGTVARDETGIRQQLEKMGYSRLIAPDGLRHDYQQALIQARSMLEEAPPQPDRVRHER